LSDLRRKVSEAFEPLLHPSRYKGAWGGRGSGKSHFFAEDVVLKAVRWPGDHGEGLRFACLREVQKSLRDSSKLLIEDKLTKFGLGEAQGFKVWEKLIETPHDGMITFDGMQDHTADSFKSKEGFHGSWTEEAQNMSERSLAMLRPTIRWEGGGEVSEHMFSWNPNRPTDAVDRLLRSTAAPMHTTVVRVNWNSNPWFPRVLEDERQGDLKNRPEQYGHVWEGEYATVLSGAYYAKHMTEAELEGRIGNVARDPLLKVYAAWDIGGTSSKSDACAIWIIQWVGNEVRFLDYYEAVGQEFSAHVNWLRANKYADAVCILPHDGRKADMVYAVTPRSYLQEAGFKVEIVANQGSGAALLRVEALRRMFPRCRFDRDKTQGGRDALGWYHAKLDEHRGIDLGPEHDFSSHGSDAAGLVAIYDASRVAESTWSKPMRRSLKGIA
jgi:phage terminase large subunit